MDSILKPNRYNKYNTIINTHNSSKQYKMSQNIIWKIFGIQIDYKR